MFFKVGVLKNSTIFAKNTCVLILFFQVATGETELDSKTLYFYGFL